MNTINFPIELTKETTVEYLALVCKAIKEKQGFDFVHVEVHGDGSGGLYCRNYNNKIETKLLGFQIDLESYIEEEKEQ